MSLKNVFFTLLLLLYILPSATAQGTGAAFSHQLETEKKPWTSKGFYNDPRNFQFAIVSDRTGGHRVGVFEKGVEKLNLLRPEFVMSVGDLIEGYTTDPVEIQTMWAEFDSILQALNVNFFAVPGNHDISNDVMRKVWLERYGRAYYHFRYKDVLFVAMDSNDGDGVVFSREQLDYVKKALADNTDVRWTLLFMHHPVWNYREFNGFPEIEEALQGRPYTVIAGHNHRYMKTMRKDRQYYILATTGGGSALRGPRMGEFDHVTWVTMTDEGPQLVHLQLSGIIQDDILNDANVELAQGLIRASNVNCLLLRKDDGGAVAYYHFENLADKPLQVEGKFYHNHHIRPDQSGFSLKIAPKSAAQAQVNLQFTSGKTLADIDPLELDWSVSYESPVLEPAFQLQGIHPLEPEFSAKELRFTEVDVFTNTHQVELSHPYKELSLRYTLDGSAPNLQSPLYTGAIQLDKTTTIKTRFFHPSGQAQSDVAEKTYRKVTPLAPVTVKKPKPGLYFRYYEGEFKTMPDFKSLSPKKEGAAADFDLEAVAMRKDHFAMVYTGFIEVPADGLYTFYTYSDDGSLLYLHDQLVVDNNGSHSARARRGYVALRKGLHPIRIEYFEDFLGEELRVGYETADQPRKEVPFTQFFHRTEK